MRYGAAQIEKAGGHSSCDGKLVSGLDVEITAHDQRTQICYGSKAEVQRFEEYVYGQSPRFAEVPATPWRPARSAPALRAPAVSTCLSSCCPLHAVRGSILFCENKRYECVMRWCMCAAG